ncbi:MAG: hypothetical protein AVDCRST_MAG68-699 [uncultured Gemmatimonadetes bacterium]|uniref:Uncharacterized protein n=1 Tax=uncultured Gemmatimonadota bacterium TaxID=203437 RepID=A0A6J4KE08_9BACT|nr:MAG: hypothetical protein AVDCRST_MAG68-699 [uncultured Gemmatimonadota bacterium]
MPLCLCVRGSSSFPDGWARNGRAGTPFASRRVHIGEHPHVGCRALSATLGQSAATTVPWHAGGECALDR